MKIGIIASHKNSKSMELLDLLTRVYPNLTLYEEISSKLQNSDIIVALGGDGFILRILHKIILCKNSPKIYGINCGNLGFLLNNFDPNIDNLIEKIEKATLVTLSSLKIEMEDKSGKLHTIHAINEISLIRQTYQAVNIKVSIDTQVKIQSLIGDGVLLATSTGSAAYNFSAGGVILPLESKLLTITAINAFRPRRWKYAILEDKSVVEFEVLDSVERPVLACADFHQFYHIRLVKAYLDTSMTYSLLFDPASHLSNKIMDEQFSL